HSATIVNANALRTDWQSLLPEGDRFDFILGNPPFIGKSNQTREQKEDLAAILNRWPSTAMLDYVTGWFIKAADYLIDYGEQKTRISFVSTNSITQGEQVGVLWSIMLSHFGCQIQFAHRTFDWSNEAK